MSGYGPAGCLEDSRGAQGSFVYVSRSSSQSLSAGGALGKVYDDVNSLANKQRRQRVGIGNRDLSHLHARAPALAAPAARSAYSTRTTCSPRSNSWPTRCEPTHPALPVTSVVTISPLDGRCLHLGLVDPEWRAAWRQRRQRRRLDAVVFPDRGFVSGQTHTLELGFNHGIARVHCPYQSIRAPTIAGSKQDAEGGKVPCR